MKNLTKKSFFSVFAGNFVVETPYTHHFLQELQKFLEDFRKVNIFWFIIGLELFSITK